MVRLISKTLSPPLAGMARGGGDELLLAFPYREVWEFKKNAETKPRIDNGRQEKRRRERWAIGKIID